MAYHYYADTVKTVIVNHSTTTVVSSEGELPTSFTSMALPLISTTTEAGWIVLIPSPLQNIHNLLSLIHFQYQISLR